MGRVPREGRTALAVLCIAQFLVVLDITAVFVAVRQPRIRAHRRPG